MRPRKRLAVSLFDRTGIMLEPWLEAGFECHLFDRVHPKGVSTRSNGMITHGGDLKTLSIRDEVLIDNVEFVSAFPPCDHLTTTGALWFKGKGLRALSDAILLFAVATEFCELAGCPYLIENPVSTISTYWRKPDFTFHPYFFTGFCEEDNYQKKTCLWTGGNFIMPEEYRVSFKTHGKWLDPPDKNYIRHMHGPDVADRRAETPRGFAKAVFQANFVPGWCD